MIVKNLTSLIKSKKFKQKNQFQKREVIGEYILTKDICKKGIKVICFEDESICDEKNRFFYQKGKNKIKTVTIGNVYEVIDIKDDQIKIENNKGNYLWFTMNRFAFSLKLERRNKLEKIIKNAK